MERLLLLLFLSITYNFCNGISIQPSEFCQKENCTCDTQKLIINCSFGKFDFVNATELWINKNEANQSYPFYKVSIRNSGINVITPFPKSDVRVLDLSMNRIEIIEKGSFAYLQNMTELDLSDNDLTSELFTSDIFKGFYAAGQYLPLKSLRVLNLANNGLHTLYGNIFEHIMNLEILDLHGNPLRVLDSHSETAISGLMNLRELDLSYSNLKRVPETIFHAPKHLEKLNLKGNELKYVPTGALANALNLKYLNLNENPIENITKDTGFPKLEHLKILHLCYMDKLQKIEDGSLSGLWNVQELYISNNPKLTEIEALALARVEKGLESHVWPKVTTLHIDHNKLSVLDSTLLTDWHLLVDLNINDNPWKCDCENQWVINELVPMAIDERKSNNRTLQMHCGSPPELIRADLVQLFHSNTTLRCSPTNGGQPEKDAGILIGILIGLLLGIPMVLGLLFCYKRNWFGYFSTGPAAFSRKFYNPATTDDDFS